MEPWHHGKCAFCEVSLGSRTEIEHFRSKTGHPLTAFVWRNLFLICPGCNGAKGAETHKGCLKPDREDPEDYLWVNPVSHRIEPKPGISQQACQRAMITIERYGLDRPELARLYNEYSLDRIFGHLLLTASHASRALTDSNTTNNQVQSHIAGLRALAQPDQPFSLMVKSLLQYYDVIR
jgi:uncharacterized protein (TIGR02646 family)